MADGPDIERAVEAATPLAAHFQSAGHSLYLVGGVVRDGFLARSYTEIDLTTDARPAEIEALVEGLADTVWGQGAEFGTIGCRIGSQDFEITTHRADAYEPGSRRPVVAFGDDIEEDLARRDFTVNAMAVDLTDGRLVDPYGGRDDLDAGILRTPLDPRISLSEDPLRMLRAARFVAVYGLTPRTELRSAVAELVDRMDIVSVERITTELEGLLCSDDPGPGFAFLASTGLWSRLLPDLPVESAEARARRVAAVAPRAPERWAALVSLADGVRDVPGRLSNALRSDMSWLLAISDRLADQVPRDDRGLRELGVSVPEGERLERAVDFAAALASANGPGPDGSDADDLEALRRRVADLRRREPDLDHPVLPLDGDQVMEILGIGPGPEVGRALDRLRRHRIDRGPLSEAEAAAIVRGD